MNEQLLQYIWQFQYFNNAFLTTAEKEPLRIIKPGIINRNQGPDFENARIQIGSTTWAGSVELHLKTSDWEKHQHQQDKNYRKVILHVVYENDRPQSGIPVLELKTRISRSLLKRYNSLMQAQSFIPCEHQILKVPAIIFNVWKSRLVAERLIRKGMVIQQYQEANEQHWEESFWWLLARNLGVPVNADAFEAMAKTIPLRILAKHKNQIHQLEALLLGQAGLLNDSFEDPYPKLLQREYAFLQRKYGLSAIAYPVQFLRMRPGNFPTLRLAQLAAIIHSSAHLFSKLLEEESLKKAKLLFKANANDFWNYHYSLRDQSTYREKAIGSAMINNIIVNTVCPILFAYGCFIDKNRLKEKAIRWLEELGAEKNTITKGFEELGLSNTAAVDSQAFIELKSRFCDERNCLHCTVGNYLLKQEK
ncbi:hypothetical protein A8C56_08520 [Niabella ginsenosidivorans]|uniref:DUF2851 domain-containing protein n=1 Tax=Niabella ginsenosidivorans TaxID=1176587 RepID=A0A1A9I070_9BACT|nr:DUF2851 family protein [Niabella ginsenosidivorans]ANH81016.1 hypothetical protein A8C56_08520 [Niabella ginsenosidivorans]